MCKAVPVTPRVSCVCRTCRTRTLAPYQVIVVEDENGCIVRETMKDNDVLAQYKSMRETLVYLCHLDYDDTEHQMLDKLRTQVGLEGRVCVLAFRHRGCVAPAGEGVRARDSAGARRHRHSGNSPWGHCICLYLRPATSLAWPHSSSGHLVRRHVRPFLTCRPGSPPQQQAGQRFAWQPLNTLCWAIGSIAGSMADDQVRRGRRQRGGWAVVQISWLGTAIGQGGYGVIPYGWASG